MKTSPLQVSSPARPLLNFVAEFTENFSKICTPNHSWPLAGYPKSLLAFSTGSGGGDGTGVGFEACETLSSDLSKVETRVMLLEDKSYSMVDNGKWRMALSAIDEMATAYGNQISFGLDLFPRSTDNNNTSALCRVGQSAISDVAPASAAAITDELSDWDPSGGTPLLLAMLNYTDVSYAPVFLDGSGGSYLVIISDGKDTCGQSGVFSFDGPGATPEQLAAVTTNLKNLFGIRTIVIGFGEGADEGPDQLNAIAQAGGTQFTTYLEASNGDELKAALSQIAESVVVSCEFHVGSFQSSNVDFNRVVVTFDGDQVGRDDGCKQNEGWTWTSEAHTTIEFCETACDQLEAGGVQQVKVVLACSEADVEIVQVE